MNERRNAERQAEFVDVQLLDVLAQIEAVLRHGRELQREALRVRGVPSPVDRSQRHASGTAIRDRADQMQADCMTLCKVVEDLRAGAQELERLLGAAT
jgi:hypothetical protein